MKKENLHELIDKLNSGTISAEDRQQLMDFYNDQQWSSDWDAQIMGDEDALKEKIYARITGQKAIHRLPARRRIPMFYKVAAACLLISLSAWFGMRLLFDQGQTTQVASAGSTKEVILPDGTKVTLNINSSISYPNSFDGALREVAFDGEGFFEVQADSLHPFIVTTPQVKIRVLGTAFNLKAYHEDPSVEASLIHGKIEVLKAEDDQVLSTLKPHEKFVMKKADASASGPVEEAHVAVKPIDFIGEDKDLPVDVAWKDGKFAFVSAPLSEITREMARRFNIDIRIENKEIADFRYSASFEKESVNDILRALTTVKGFSYRKEGQAIVIY